MADKKKMSVADMLAAARKSDGGDAASSGETPAQPVADETPAAPAAGASPAKPVPKPGSADRPNVSDILAMARSGKSAAEKPAAKPAPKPAAKSPAAKPAAAKAKPAAAGPAEPRDTASILAAIRKKDRPGPISKSDAAAAKSSPKAAATAKAKLAVPPMPAKPDYAKPKPKTAAKASPAEQDRRGFLHVGFWMLGLVTAAWTALAVRFFFPNVLREPPSQFKVGSPSDFPVGTVTTKFKPQYGVWIVNTEYNGKEELVALKSVCTHLGCTPNWLEAEQKFKCPC
ncbi:MAG: Rieske 2Fe-2S domain-containing protein, partial [Planctomycetales bacterium]|nr:Rieske 2Fe-2S domain-containing protein [Planctomycetales bacterium]